MSKKLWLWVIPIFILGNAWWKAGAGDFSTPVRLYGLGEVRLLAASPDLRFLASAGQGGAFMWDMQSTSLLHRLDLDWSVTALTFSPDSKFLCLASGNTITAWEPESGKRLQQFPGHKGEINRLRFAPGGEELVSASADNTVRIWSMATGAELRSVRTPGSPILDVAISPDGRKLATVDTFLTNSVKLWDAASGEALGAVPQTNWVGQRCLFTAEGQLLVSSADRVVSLWDTETLQLVRSFGGITNELAIISDLWLPNDSSLAAVCNDGTVYLWNLNTGALVRIVPGDPVLAAAGVPYDFLIIGANYDNNVRVRQLPGGDVLRAFEGHTTSVHSGVAFSPDGRYVLSGGTESSTRLWDRQTGRQIRAFSGSPAGTMAVAFSPDGSRLLTTVGVPSPRVRLWNTETGALERELPLRQGWPTAAAFSTDGRLVAAHSQGQDILIFDAATGAVVQTLTNRAWASAIAFSPTAPLLAAAGNDSTVILYNHESGQALHSFSANAGSVVSVAFSPDGTTLLVGWQDGLARLFNTFTMEVRREFVSLAAFLEDAAFSPDGRYVLTGEGWPSFTATLWDSETGDLLHTFWGHKWSVSALAFSADGRSFLTGADIVREWALPGAPTPLRIEKLAHELRLTWGSGVLQRASRPDGPWETMENALSPLAMAPDEPRRFYRLR